MSELDDFLTPTLDRQLDAEKALINGDPGPRLAMWSTQDPVTMFGGEERPRIRGGAADLTLRVTHVYRREDGEWKIVHRHADVPPTGQPLRADASTE
jgi:hypothetical protein